MPSLPNTVRAAGGQYPPGAEAYVALPPSHPYPDHSPPHTPEMPPRTFEAGYSLRDAKDTSGPEPRPSYHQGTQYRGSSYRPEKEERQEHLHGFHRPERDERSRSSYGFERDDRAGSSYRPMYRDPPASGPPWNKEHSSTGRHTGRIELSGSRSHQGLSWGWNRDSRGGSPAAGKAVGALEMKVKMGAHNPAYTNASLEYLERIVGPRSPLEASYLKGFQYLKRLDALGAIAQSPFKDEMNVLETYKTLRLMLQRGHLKFEEWCSEVDRLEGKTYLSLALVRLATHMALDTIAYLGSLESPVFSPDETLMGAIFGPSLEPQAPGPGTPDNGMRWNAMLMERLGVPCWGIMPRVGPQQLDFDAGGRPDADPLKEADFQKGMRVISQDQQPLQVVVYSQKCPCSPPSSPPVGPREFSDDLKAVIIRALDSEMPDAYTIEESSAKLKGL
ncbi:hypothetical protein BS47DRAFT_1401692 [Hydnum rufescens UP504]|uniref:Uncharacterized protein n=1 Tax=Hydnum rufescens UP504 TaxID=1448309 RepID=A0A9P6AED7_9AGAM|nr:hypothetical protein BS47DRAFT_1401692 [Hydnum rufescens UP504]